MIIAQMTDIHIGFEPEARPEELNRQRFRAVLDRIQKQPNPVDLLLLTGDITDRGDRESFEKTAELLRALDMPVKALVGNHDTREELLNAFPETETTDDGFVQSAWVQDGLLVILLDTLETGRHGGAFCEKRAAWFAAALADNPDVPAVIFMHHPPVISGIEWMDPDPADKWLARLAAALKGHEDRIEAIHCGHLHRQLVARFCGIPVSVTPSVAPLVSMDLRSDRQQPSPTAARLSPRSRPPMRCIAGRTAISPAIMSGWATGMCLPTTVRICSR